jgi:tRNA (cytidine/uridine-2'-O-)-methyltransferase
MHVVLVEPEIHVNAGNIARTCACVGATLHFIRPLGFSTEDRYLKRAGLDYWHTLDLHYWDSFAELQADHPSGRFFFVETTGERSYADVRYQADDFLVFGRETKGLPADLLAANRERVVRIPMVSDVRSLNLSNAVALTLYEALRQVGFPHLS